MNEHVSVRNIMTPDVITVDEDERLSDVATKLAEKNVSGAPVLDSDRNITGMISDGDILRFLNAYDPKTDRACKIPDSDSYKICRQKFGIYTLEPTLAKDIFDVFEMASQKPAREVMVSPAVTASADSDVEDVSLLMMSRNIKRVPILDDGKLVGIVSRADIVKYVAKRKKAKEYAESR
jgi:CBS domain-containing protein